MESNDNNYKTPYTERANIITSNIDIAEVIEIIKLIQKTEYEIFQEWYEDEPALLHASISTKIDCLATYIADLITRKCGNVKVILSGCGTSGRLGFIACKKFNDLCRKMNQNEVIDYLISGDDWALFKSLESVEDDPLLGKSHLNDVIYGIEKCIFLGISCGLSASFVAGQIDLALEKAPECIATLIGFNPVEMAKDTKIQKISFKDVVLKIDDKKEEKGILINPVIGPEPIAGSSRMKGGTTTKIILDTLFLTALAKCFGDTNIDCKIVMKTYKASLDFTDQIKDNIANCIEKATDSLLSNGHVCYIGLNALGYYGILDASECVPTFGVDYNDIRGFIKGGFEVIGNKQGDLSNDNINISLRYFGDNVMQQLTSNDYVIVYGDRSNAREMHSLKRSLEKKKCKVTLMLLCSGNGAAVRQHEEGVWQTLLNDSNNIIIDITLNDVFADCQIQNELRMSLIELSLKRIFNMISTGAFIMKGKIWKNMMIDLKVSNDKLLKRAISIIMQFTHLKRKDAFEYLLKALFQTDTITEEMRNADVTYLITIGGEVDQVVPMAMLLATGSFTVETARDILHHEKIVRKCLIEKTKN